MTQSIKIQHPFTKSELKHIEDWLKENTNDHRGASVPGWNMPF